MFRYIIKKAKFFSLNRQNQKALKEELSFKPGDDLIQEKLTKSLEENLSHIKQIFASSHDLKTHSLKFGKDKINAALIYIDGLADAKFISNTILKSLIDWDEELKNKQENSSNQNSENKPQTQNKKQNSKKQGGTISQNQAQESQSSDDEKEEKDKPQNQIMQTIKTDVLFSCDTTEAEDFEALIKTVLNGDLALMVEGASVALRMNSTGFEKRAITEPASETVVRGPREGFTENIKTNATLIRRKIKSSKLRVEHMIVGKKTNTDVYVMYLEDVAKQDIVKQVKARLIQIKVDGILETGYLEQYIEDAPFSPFSTLSYTEKPDVIAGKLLEGRVAILVDGTPFVLTAPMLFVESFQTSEDYYTRHFQASFNRIVRFIAYFFAIFLPAIYIALTSFHQELIPTTLLLTVANAREGTPFPVFVEVLIMVFAFEVLREAGIRLPRPVGQAISIVGALIMGEAAVSAGLVGAPMVITIALTAVSSFLVPTQNDSATVLRGVMMILAALLGFYGIMLGVLSVLIHLCSLTSFGVPYFDAFSFSRDLKDSVIRAPLWTMKRRPKDVVGEDETRIRMSKPPTTSGENRLEKEGQGGVADGEG